MGQSLTKFTTISAGRKAKYLSEVLKILPSNCLLHKGVTGCGGTTMELNSDRHSIIAVPTTTVAINKAQQYGMEKSNLSHKILAVHGKINEKKKGVSIGDIEDYIQECFKDMHPIKIMCTYDSLMTKVVPAFDNAGLNARENAFLLVDEYHVMLDAYGYRNKAITGVLSNFNSFNKYCFMTATPHEPELMLEELKQVPEVIDIAWADATKVNIQSVVTSKPKSEVLVMIKKTFAGKSYGNLHIFVNSVTMIASIILALKAKNKRDGKPLNYNMDNIRVSCADTEKNKAKLGSMKISNDHMHTKKINFYTSKCFEGCDIYDKDGKTVVVSDSSAAFTLTDIGTTMKQIVGRLRDSGYNDNITHIIHPNTRYYGTDGKPISTEEFESFIARKIVISTDIARMLSGNNDYCDDTVDDERSKFSQEKLGNRYISQTGEGVYVFDNNLALIDRATFKRATTYSDFAIIKTEYRDKGFDNSDSSFIKSDEYENFDVSDAFMKNPVSKLSFKKAYIEYSRIKKDINAGDTSGNRLDRVELISMYNPLVEQAFRLLGDEKVKSVNYRTTNVKRKIKALSSGGAEVVQRCISVIIDTLESAFTGVIEVVMTRASLEGRIKSVFLSNGIDEKPKVKILERHLSIKQFRKRVVDNKGNKKDIPMVRLSKL